MSRVIMPRGFEPGDVINPDYVNDNFEALAEASNGLGPSNIQARSIPQSALESPMALGQIVVPLGHEYVDLAIDNGAAGDGAENMVVLSPSDVLGEDLTYFAFAGISPSSMLAGASVSTVEVYTDLLSLWTDLTGSDLPLSIHSFHHLPSLPIIGQSIVHAGSTNETAISAGAETKISG